MKNKNIVSFIDQDQEVANLFTYFEIIEIFVSYQLVHYVDLVFACYFSNNFYIQQHSFLLFKKKRLVNDKKL